MRRLHVSRLLISAVAIVASVSATPRLSADEAAAKVDKIFARWDSTASPGCALAVIKDGRIIYKRGYGMAKLEDGIVMTPDKIFDIGSVSKQFTAACIAMLVREGKVGLDDEVQKYFPRLPRYARPITIRHLLHHTSGLRDYNSLLAFAGFRSESDCPNVDEALEIVFRQKGLNHLPGDEYSYTNTGYFLLGQIVEKVSGKSLNAFAQERIFRPLGMINTLYQENHLQVIRNRATGYDRTDTGFQIDMSDWDETGDGNVYTSVEDLYLWDQAFYDGKLGEGLTDLLQQPGVLNNGKKLDYAWGLGVREYKGLRNVEHAGAWAGFRAAISRFPDQNFTVICLANLNDINPSALADQVANIYLAGVLREPASAKVQEKAIVPVALTQVELDDKVGNYRAEGAAAWVTVRRDGDKLMVAAPVRLPPGAGREAALVPTSKTTFEAQIGSVPISLEFLPEKDGHSGRAVLTVREEKIFLVKARPVPKLTAVQLGEYAGTYVSPELLDAAYTVYADGEKLVLKFRVIPENTVLRPMAPDLYNISSADVEFTRGATGRVTGFTLSSGRMLGITFQKKPDSVVKK